MGDIEIDGKKIRAHEALTEGKKKSKLTIDNYVFFKSVLLDDDIEALIEERQAARKAKNFARADEIRDLLADKGIILEDTRAGVKWKRA